MGAEHGAVARNQLEAERMAGGQGEDRLQAGVRRGSGCVHGLLHTIGSVVDGARRGGAAAPESTVGWWISPVLPSPARGRKKSSRQRGSAGKFRDRAARLGTRLRPAPSSDPTSSGHLLPRAGEGRTRGLSTLRICVHAAALRMTCAVRNEFLFGDAPERNSGRATNLSNPLTCARGSARTAFGIGQGREGRLSFRCREKVRSSLSALDRWALPSPVEPGEG